MSRVDPLHLEYFKFAGRVIALALIRKVQVGIVFDRVFFQQLAGKKVSVEDIRDTDPVFYSSCKRILEMDPDEVDQDALALTFIVEADNFGSKNIVELLPDGKNISVNSKNRVNYVARLVQYHFVDSVKDQVAQFTQGFDDIMNSDRLRESFFQCLELEDLIGCCMAVKDLYVLRIGSLTLITMAMRKLILRYLGSGRYESVIPTLIIYSMT